MNEIWLTETMKDYLPYFEREDKDDFLYIATKEQLAEAAKNIMKALKKESC